MRRHIWTVEAGDEVKPLFLCQASEDDISSWSPRRGLAREFKDETTALQVCRLLNRRGGPHGIARVMNISKSLWPEFRWIPANL